MAHDDSGEIPEKFHDEFMTDEPTPVAERLALRRIVDEFASVDDTAQTQCDVIERAARAAHKIARDLRRLEVAPCR